MMFVVKLACGHMKNISLFQRHGPEVAGRIFRRRVLIKIAGPAQRRL